MNSTKQTNKFARFLKNNLALILIIFCVIAITTVVLCVTLIKPKETITEKPVVVDPDPDIPDDPVVENPDPEIIKVYFAAPLQYKSVSMEYTTSGGDSMFVFNNTLGNWQAHKALDLAADEGTNVCAMYDGVVTDIGYTYGMGNTVTIDHGDGIVATYASLRDVVVSKGATVTKGQVIGTVGTTASFEYMDGAHLHLEVYNNGQAVDPTPYITGEIFREVEQPVQK